MAVPLSSTTLQELTNDNADSNGTAMKRNYYVAVSVGKNHTEKRKLGAQRKKLQSQDITTETWLFSV